MLTTVQTITVEVLKDICQGFKLINKFESNSSLNTSYAGGFTDKSVDLPAEQIQFRDETSDHDGLSTSFIGIDSTRASTLALICRFLTISVHRSHCWPAQPLTSSTVCLIVFWLAGDVFP